MVEYKLNIFRILSEIDKKNINFYTSLSEEEKKAFVPVLIARWLTGIRNKQQIFFINELVNPLLFSLYKHPELLYYLMTLCTNGKVQRYNWIKALSKTHSKPATIKIIQQYFGYNSKDAEQVINLLNSEDIITMAETMGWQDEDINKARKELGIKPIKSSTKLTKITQTNPISSDFEF